jgi:hypothetical protein
VKRTPGDEEAVCVRLFQIFSSCPVLASVFLFLLSSTSVTFCSFFFPVLQMLYVKKMKAKTERDDELVRLVVLLRLLFLLSGVVGLPFLLVCAVAGAVGGVAIFVYWLLVSSSFYLPSGSSGAGAC